VRPPVGTHVVERVERGKSLLALLETEKARNWTLRVLLQAFLPLIRVMLEKYMIFSSFDDQDPPNLSDHCRFQDSL